MADTSDTSLPDDPDMAVVDPDIADLVPGFLDNRRSDLGQMRAAFGSGDLDRIRALGHNLKGCGASYGFPRMSELGAGLEAAARDGERAQLETLLDALEERLRTVRWRVGPAWSEDV